MKALRQRLSLLLALAVMTAGYPVVHGLGTAPGPDQGLEEAVRVVSAFSRTADNPADFGQEARQAIATLRAAAGLVPVISSASSTCLDNSQFSHNLFLISQGGFSQGPGCFYALAPGIQSLPGVDPAPPLRPPQNC